MSKLIFEIPNTRKVSELIFDLKDENKDRRCIFIPLPEDLKQKLISRKRLSKKLRKEIEEKAQDFVEKDRKELLFFIKKIRKVWNKISLIYFKEVEKILEEKFAKKYVCYVTNAIIGAYFIKGELKNTISSGTCRPYDNQALSRAIYTIAEELLHLIYWKKWSKVFNKKYSNKIYEGKKWSSWHISEVVPEYVLKENKTFRKFGWHKMKGYLFCHRLRKATDPLWKNKKNFSSFLVEAHRVCRCFK